MNVHEAITSHAKMQNEKVSRFLQLDRLREQAIEEALRLCKEGLPYSVDEINRIAGLMDELVQQDERPARKRVTSSMIEEFARRS